MVSYRNSTNIQTQVTNDILQDTYETNTNGTNIRILVSFDWTPYCYVGSLFLLLFK